MAKAFIHIKISETYLGSHEDSNRSRAPESFPAHRSVGARGSVDQYQQAGQGNRHAYPGKARRHAPPKRHPKWTSWRDCGKRGATAFSRWSRLRLCVRMNWRGIWADEGLSRHLGRRSTSLPNASANSTPMPAVIGPWTSFLWLLRLSWGRKSSSPSTRIRKNSPRPRVSSCQSDKQSRQF